MSKIKPADDGNDKSAWDGIYKIDYDNSIILPILSTQIFLDLQIQHMYNASI